MPNKPIYTRPRSEYPGTAYFPHSFSCTDEEFRRLKYLSATEGTTVSLQIRDFINETFQMLERQGVVQESFYDQE